MNQILRGVAIIALAMVLFLGMAICCYASIADLTPGHRMIATLSDTGPPVYASITQEVVAACREPANEIIGIDLFEQTRYSPPTLTGVCVKLLDQTTSMCISKAEPAIPKRE